MVPRASSSGAPPIGATPSADMAPAAQLLLLASNKMLLEGGAKIMIQAEMNLLDRRSEAARHGKQKIAEGGHLAAAGASEANIDHPQSPCGLQGSEAVGRIAPPPDSEQNATSFPVPPDLPAQYGIQPPIV